MIKILFFDVDGTLLSKNRQRLTKELKEAFDTLKKKGVLIALATGRHMCELEALKILTDYSFDAYVTLNGCYCYNEKEVIYKAVIDTESIQNIINAVNEKDIACAFVEEEGLYINQVNDYVKAAQEFIHSPIPQIKDITRALNHDIYQIIPFISKEETEALTKVTTNCMITRWHPLAYDIVPINGGKQKGIEEILSYYHIKQEETMAFGDGHNDIEMLEYVHIGVCMGNGEEETKQISDFVTKTVDEDGILYALKHFALI
jgi:Cof subfamily protein (haloacid dehalogenase superfamily)